MKAAAVFAIRVLALTLVLTVAFIFATNAAGMAHTPLPSAQAASTPTAQAQQAASVLIPLLAYTFLISLVIARIIQSSRWRGLKLIAALVFTFYGLMTVISQIETIAYLRAKMPPVDPDMRMMSPTRTAMARRISAPTLNCDH